MFLKPTPTQAILWSLTVPITFLLGIYVWKLFNPKSQAEQPDNNTSQIKRRIFSCLVTSLLQLYVLCKMFNDPDTKGANWYQWFGLQLEFMTYAGCMSALSLAMVLFFGAILAYGLSDEPIDEKDSFDMNLWTFKKVFVAPLLEGISFRACIIVPLLAAKFDSVFVVLFSPVLFGLTHMVHALKGGFLPAFFQFSYTYLFGVFASVVYIVTSNLFASATVHGFCNLMGYPDLGFFRQKHSGYNLRYVILLGYIIGIVGFYKLAPLMLDSELFESTIAKLNK